LQTPQWWMVLPAHPCRAASQLQRPPATRAVVLGRVACDGEACATRPTTQHLASKLPHHVLDCDLFQCVAARIELFADHPGLQLVRAQTPASGPDNCIVIDAQADVWH
jgi:hypothetical protein